MTGFIVQIAETNFQAVATCAGVLIPSVHYFFTPTPTTYRLGLASSTSSCEKMGTCQDISSLQEVYTLARHPILQLVASEKQ
eukprot:SM000130S27080  [mRNA]  locus=s130:72048:72837:+ [translate_table: standard]